MIANFYLPTISGIDENLKWRLFGNIFTEKTGIETKIQNSTLLLIVEKTVINCVAVLL